MEPFEREHGADDVDDRVERAHLVQMNLVDRDLVDGGFGFAKPMKQLLRASLRRRRQRRALDQRVDLGEAAMRMMVRDVLVPMAVVRGRAGRVRAA